MADLIRILIVFILAHVFLTVTFIYQASSHFRFLGSNLLSQNILKPKVLLASGDPLKVTVIETRGTHDEVVAAIVYSWGKIPSTELEFFQLSSRYGSHNMIRTFNLINKIPRPRPLNDFLSVSDSNQRIPDILISATCETDMARRRENMTYLLLNHNTYIFCIIHNADHWNMEQFHLEEIISPWLRKRRLEFLALSPHTAEFMQKESLSKWKIVAKEGVKLLVRWFVPVFPVQFPPAPRDDKSLSFGLQGNFEQKRRDYKMIFSRLREFLRPHSDGGSTSKTFGLVSEMMYKTLSKKSAMEIPSAENGGNISSNAARKIDSNNLMRDLATTTETKVTQNITLHLIGHGKHPSVPADVRKFVVFDEDLNYINFYTVISRTFALLPAFATEAYLDRKASSTVPASLIAGVPLVATQRILDKYAYVTNDTVWLQSADETDFDVISRVLKLSHDERLQKKAKVQAHAATIIERNTELAYNWTVQALRKIGVKVTVIV